MPFLYFNYCFPKDDTEDPNQTVLIGKLKPVGTNSGSTVAVPVNAEGPTDQYGFYKLRAFIRNHNVGQIVCRCDRERSLVAAIEHVYDSLPREGFQLVFEKSPVGDSQSNGIAERTMQSVEDVLRTLRGAFIGHTKMRVSMDHPAMLWCIKHTASILNRFVVGGDGQTA